MISVPVPLCRVIDAGTVVSVVNKAIFKLLLGIDDVDDEVEQVEQVQLLVV